MRIVTNQELSTFKVLPFDILSESNAKILSAGEVLTPGKLIMLKNYPKLYTEEYCNDADKNDVYDRKEQINQMTEFTYDTLDIEEFETTLNKDCILESKEQIRSKYYYRKVYDLFLQGYFYEGLLKLTSLAHIIYTNFFKRYGKTQKCSQIRFMGEYEICHPLNVGIIAGLIAKKLDYSPDDIKNVILAGFLHDIGKYKIVLPNESSITTLDEREIAEHTTLGYNLIKNELNLPEEIAKVAMEHHENNDGSGYPQGLSNDYISEVSQIINVSNFYDNMVFNRFSTHISSNREALRAMLEIGTKRFSAKILYTFIHLFTYDDLKNFSEMSL